MKIAKIIIIGFGNVGRAFARTIALKKKFVESRYGVSLSVVGVADSKGMALKSDGFSEYELLKLCEVPRSGVNLFSPYAYNYVDLKYMYDMVQPDIHVELTPANYVTGEPGLTNIMFALTRGAHVVTANKAPIVLKYKELLEIAKKRSLQLRFRSTVMGGTPLIDTIMSLRSEEIEKIEGILNATTNFILTEMHDKLIDFEEALKKAQIMGLAEADPSLDIDGIDAAAKLVILSHVIGCSISLDEVKRESLSKIKLRDVVEAIKEGFVIKYLAYFDVRRRETYVRIVKIPKTDVFAQVNGSLNAVRIKTDVGEILFVGKGGGGLETAHSVLDDVIAIAIGSEGGMR
ncbi:MAG: homoserine dehydrogenase [Desulfurococcaceae archaeon]|jgi:homoserine dehydrogenase|nr:homoserine dehydrogenase [Desulfurococcaceae archaeon]